MPDRMLRVGLLTSPNFNRYSLLAQCLAVRLIVVVDDLGRYHGTATAVRAACFPEMEDRVSVDEVEAAIGELCAGDDAMLARYQIGGRLYLHFPNWGTHQRLRSKTSRFPDPETGRTRADQARDAINARWHPNTPADNPNTDARNRNTDAPGDGDGVGVPPISPPTGGDVNEEPKNGKPKPHPPADWAMQLASLIEETQMRRHPNRTPSKHDHIAKGAVEIERLHTIDKHPISDIEATCRWAMADERPVPVSGGFPGWAGVVQCGGTFRKRWNNIVAQMPHGHNGKAGEDPRRNGDAATRAQINRAEERLRQARERSEGGAKGSAGSPAVA